MQNIIQHNPPHPGEILSELYFVPLNLTVNDVAKRLKISRNKLTAILNGKAGLSASTALRFARTFKTTPLYWMNLQANYDLWLAREFSKAEINKILFTRCSI